LTHALERIAVITSVFVYGTLQRGQCRAAMWPRSPRAVSAAFVRGRLYDLGPYPALRCDDDDLEADWVAGELWSFTADDLPATIRELDRIEETNQSGAVNLYDRILVRARPEPASAQGELALAYQYSDAARLPEQRRVRPAGSAIIASWPA
jgi:gamma-glutamylcyclotransferase (GGCT)/AIG2-like uncharacterized protein YtfP